MDGILYLLPCPICNGVEGCDHSVAERRLAIIDKLLREAEDTARREEKP